METNWIEVSKVGTWTAKNGAKVTLTHGDLDAIAGAYEPADREAPLVFGHPKDDHPAFGWATRMKRAGDILLAKFKQVPQSVKDLVDGGHYKKVSISLMPDKKTLRHVGLLGAAQPAVPGLADVKFSNGDDDAVVLEFSTESAQSGNSIAKEEDAMDEVAKLKKKLADEKEAREAAEERANTAEADAEKTKTELAARAATEAEGKIDTRIEELVAKNRIVPGEKDAVKAVALALGKSDKEIELSDGAGKKTVVEHLFDFLSGLPGRGLLTEFSEPSGDGKDTGETAVDLTACV